MIKQLLDAELSHIVAACLDVESLLALQGVSKTTLNSLRDGVEARCKSECFTRFLHATMATYRMAAAVPKSWKLLYLQFSSLRKMEWSVCKTEGTSSSLRLLKTDNQEYAADLHGKYLLRSGGHYWFSVLQTPLEDVTLSNPSASNEELKQQIERLEAAEREKALEFLRSPMSVNVGKWEKLRATGAAPCPRRHHTMTCLPTVVAPLSILDQEPTDVDPSARVAIRRVLFFGGQAEGIPFEAFNDLHLLAIEARPKSATSSKTMSKWISPDASGQPPSRRCGHETTLLSKELLLISGGSDGTTPLPQFEIFLLHIEADGGWGRFRWSTPVTSSLPSGRAMHNICKMAEGEVLIFGGRQIRQSNNLLEVFRLKLNRTSEESWEADWCEPELSGCVPGPRRGHSTCVIGNSILLIGGQDTATGELHCDVRVLDVPALQWRFPKLEAEPSPCPRRGFKTQYFGTSLVVSSGFVMDPKTSKVNQQLPDSDIYVLTPL